MSTLLTDCVSLAYVPFRDPLPLHDYWMWLLFPLVVGVAVVYKAIKLDDLSMLPKQAAWLTMQIVVFMILAATALWAVTEMF